MSRALCLALSLLVATAAAPAKDLIGVFEGSSTAEDALMKGPKGPARFLATYDADRESYLIGVLAKNVTWQCPTLYWERGQWLVDSIDVSKDPDARYAPASWRDLCQG